MAKAELPNRGPNPRFRVTLMSFETIPTQLLYEQIFRARGEMENRNREQQPDLFADRTSTHTFRLTNSGPEC